jgi:hypothetical protein
LVQPPFVDGRRGVGAHLGGDRVGHHLPGPFAMLTDGVADQIGRLPAELPPERDALVHYAGQGGIHHLRRQSWRRVPPGPAGGGGQGHHALGEGFDVVLEGRVDGIVHHQLYQLRAARAPLMRMGRPEEGTLLIGRTLLLTPLLTVLLLGFTA